MKKNFKILLVTTAFVACTTAHQTDLEVDQVKEASSATPTVDVPIVIDGQFDDWQQVLLNPLQVSVDGNGIDGNGCYPTRNSDRDCDDFTTQRDVTVFAWTYDNTNVYTYIQRPPSASTLTYSFIMDVDADGLVESSDRVMQVDWKNGGRTLDVRLYAYIPAVAGGDPIACPNTAACQAAGNAHAETDYIDGYDMPGTIGALIWSPPSPGACGSPGQECGGDNLGTNGQRFETLVPWAQLGVPARAPILWHVATSTNTTFNNASDNVGGPDGKAGTFGTFGVDFFPDRIGSANSPGSVDYCHTISNIGNFQDRYNLRATSTTGSSLTFLNTSSGCTPSTTIAVDANGDGDFLDVGDSITPGADSNGDGLPDTGVMAASATRNIVIRVATPSGIIGATDVTTATARSVTRPVLVFDDVVDRTRIGPVTVQPDFNLAGTPGATVDFGPFTVQNNQSSADNFDLFVRSSNGYTLRLYTNAGGVPGTLLGTDTNGDGTWDGATPATGALAATGGTAQFWVRETIPGGAAINTVDSMRLIATSQTTPSVTGQAQNILRVLNALTIAPSYTAPNGQIFGPAGTSVYLSHTITNALGVVNTVALSQSGTLAAGYGIRWWTDPNGDGNIADGTQITGSFNLAAFGGQATIVTEITIPASGTPTSTAAATTVTGISSSSASANDHVAVGNLQTYEDALFARPTRYFPACSTVFAKAANLNPLQATFYQLRFDNSLGAAVQNANMATNAQGVGTGSYVLLAADAPGAWRVRVFHGATLDYDLNPFTVESSGSVLATAPATAVNGPLPVSAQLTSLAQQADYAGTTLTFELRDPTNALVTSTTVSMVTIPFGSSTVEFALFPNVTYAVTGNYTVNAIWRSSCGTTIGSGSTVVANAPPAPTLVSPANGATVGTNTPTLTGTAMANATVNVTRDGSLVGTATANGSGNWSFTTIPLSQGAHTWSATQTVLGATGPSSPTRTFIVDTVAPAPPVVVNPADGLRTNNTTPTIDGTAEANSSVAVSVSGNVVGTVTANGSGAWTYTLTAGQALTQGTYTATARATDLAGNLSAISNTNTFVIDTTPPLAPVVTNPANGSVTSSTQPTIDGTAEANASVQVFVDCPVGGCTVANRVATVTANASGNWAYTLTALQALSNGAHNAAARATDLAGNLGPQSAVNNFTVDTSVPPAPVVVTPANGSRTNDTTPTISGTVAFTALSVEVFIGGNSVAVIPGPIATGVWSYTLTAGQALTEGTYSATARATNLASTTSPLSAANIFTVDLTPPPAPAVILPANGSRTNDTTPTVSGTAEANSTVAVFIGATQVGTTTADASGNWSYTLDGTSPGNLLVAGNYNASAIATDVAGNTGPATSPPNNFTVDLTPPAAPVVVTPADGSRTNDATPTISGTAEALASVEVFIGGNLVGTVPADGSGNWTYTLLAGQALIEGTYVATARATDVAGNQGATTNPGNSFTVDETPPAVPVIVAPANNSRINTGTPIVSGTAEANATVTVFIDGVQLGTAVANGSGNWSYQVTGAQLLDEGSHLATARATDVAGNIGATTTPGNTFFVDLTAPAAPVVVVPANGTITNDITPTISGTAEAGSSVAVFINGNQVGTATTDINGSWSYALTSGQALTAGNYAATARATDVAGNVSGLSNPNNFTVDLTPPAAPVVIAPADGSRTNNATPTVSGTAEANASVAVFIDGSLVGTVSANGSGAWSYTLTGSQALNEGAHTASARATDVAGNQGPASGVNNFTVDLTAPAAPAITTPTNNQLTNDNTPTIGGTAEPGSTVRIFDGATQIGTATADGSGNWTFTVPNGSALTDGTHPLTATATDVAGNTSAASNPAVNLVVDATAPAAPVVTAPANNSITNDNTPTVTGTAEANATVAVFIGATQVGTATADASGNWTYTLTSGQALADGSFVVTARATDPAGNQGPASTGNNFTVDTAAPAAPVITQPQNNSSTNDTTPTITGTAEAGATVRVYVGTTLVGTVTADASGNWTYTLTSGQALSEGSYAATATATDPAGNTGPASGAANFTVDTTAPGAPVVVTPANSSTIGDNTPTISGTAEANASVAVTVDGTVVGTVSADASGNWTYTLTAAQALSNGQHTASARATDAAGNPSPVSNTNTFTIDAMVPAAPVVLNPKDGSLTNDDTPTVSGTAEANSTVQVTIDGTVVGTVAADAQGNWTYTLTSAQKLSDGSHVVSAIATDSAGNASPRSNQNTFTVDATPPPAPVVTSPTQGQKTSDNTPTFTGTAEANSTVRIYVDDVLVGTVTTDATGNWTFTPTAQLSDGAHTVTATSTDAAGNTSPLSTPRNFVVDTFDAGTGGGGGAGGGQGGGGGGGGVDPTTYGYRGGGCACGTSDTSAMAGLGFLLLFAFARRRQPARARR